MCPRFGQILITRLKCSRASFSSSSYSEKMRWERACLLRKDVNFRLKVAKEIAIQSKELLKKFRLFNNTGNIEVKFCICFFANRKFLLFLVGHILLVLFYLINLIVAYTLNENKPQLLLATFEN